MRRRHEVALAAAVACVLAMALPAAAAVGAPASVPAWGTAKEVPRTATLNRGGHAWLGSLSCAYAGNCSAAGSYHDSSGRAQAFVVSEVKGTWHYAIEAPGSGVLNTGGAAAVESVSCPSGGDCGAGGYYTDRKAHQQGFVISEAHGVWGKAIELPALGTLNTGGAAIVDQVSCPSAGMCAAAGTYMSVHLAQVFVTSQAGGTWQPVRQLPGIAVLNKGGAADVGALSCPAPGDCSAGGYYTDSSGNLQAYLASEVGGTWQAATEVPGTAALNAGGSAQVTAMSCPSPGNCSAGGEYQDGAGFQQAFVVSEVKGTWQAAKEVPATATLNTGGLAALTSLSCAAAGYCGAGGYYSQSSSHVQAFVVSETGGTWGQAEEVPGTAALNTLRNGGLSAISCAGDTRCSAGGYYTQKGGQAEVFVVTEVNGRWETAREVAGTAALNKGGFDLITALSCGSPGHCSAGGYYTDGSRRDQAFVVKQS